MKFLFSSRKIYMIARIGLGLVFISSGFMKMSDLESFSKVIEAFEILPSDLCYFFALVISSGETVAGLGLVADLKGSLGAILLMLVGFTAVLTYALLMGYDIDCGCFGPDDPETEAFSSLRGSLARDICMIGQVLFLYFWRIKNNYLPFSPNFNKKQEVS